MLVNMSDPFERLLAPAYASDPRPYFPMLLGNGADSVLIGYNGSMGGGGSHEQFGYDNAVQAGWYKADRRGAKTNRLMNLLQAGYVVLKGVRAQGVDRVDQRFDAVKALLHTKCRICGSIQVDVTTFVTKDHRLVHRFKVKAPETDTHLQFYIKPPDFWWLYADLPDKVTLHTRPTRHGGKAALKFSVEAPELDTMKGLLVTDAPGAKAVTCFSRSPGLDIPVRGTVEFAVAVELTDAEDRQAKPSLLTSRKPFDYKQTLADHVAEWKHFDAQGGVTLSNAYYDELYRASLHTLRAQQHPHGSVSVGSYPLMWYSGHQPFDAIFPHAAFLGANRLTEGRGITDINRLALPKLKKLAADVGLPGFVCPGDITHNGDAVGKLPADKAKRREAFLTLKLFLTAFMGAQAWNLYRFTGRRADLEENWELLVEAANFLCGSCIREFKDHAEIIPSSAPNGKERVKGKSVHFPNPLRSVVVTLMVLEGLVEGSKILGREARPEWARLHRKLLAGIETNRIEGVLRASRSPKAIPNINMSVAGIYSNCFLERKTLLQGQFKLLLGPDGLFRWEDHGYTVVPWMHFNASAALSRIGHKDAAKQLEVGARFTTTLGAFPEGVRPDGVYWKTWYPSPHGSFVNAIHRLLVNETPGRIELFAGLPESWGDATFSNLRVPPGFLVSGSRKKGKVRVKLTNDGDFEQTVTVVLHGATKLKQKVSLGPGKSISLKA